MRAGNHQGEEDREQGARQEDSDRHAPPHPGAEELAELCLDCASHHGVAPSYGATGVVAGACSPGMAIGVFLAGALFAVLFALVVAGSHQERGPGGGGPPLPGLDNTTMVSTVYTAGLSLAYLLTLVVGVMSIGSEYRHKTITSTFLSTPKRVRVMVAKVTSLLGIGVFYGLVFLVGSVGVGGAAIAIKGFSPFPEVAPIARALALSLLVLGLWSLVGLGAGILIPNQVAAILIAVGAAFIVEPLAGFPVSYTHLRAHETD